MYNRVSDDIVAKMWTVLPQAADATFECRAWNNLRETDKTTNNERAPDSVRHASRAQALAQRIHATCNGVERHGTCELFPMKPVDSGLEFTKPREHNGDRVRVIQRRRVTVRPILRDSDHDIRPSIQSPKLPGNIHGFARRGHVGTHRTACPRVCQRE